MPGFSDHVGQEVGEKYLKLVELGMPPLPPGVKYEVGGGWTAWDVTPEPEHGGIGITAQLAEDVVVMHAIRTIQPTDESWVRGLAAYRRSHWLDMVVAYYAIKAGS